MTVTRLIGLILFFDCGIRASADPMSDLSSTNQETRDAAAKIVRKTYTPPARTEWDALVASLKPGASKTNVLNLLGPFASNTVGGGGTGTWEFCRYRLDTLWVLECYFESQTFKGCKLLEYSGRIWVDPPPKFTGLWITYHMNGQKATETHFRDGKRHGRFKGFHDDGSVGYTVNFEKGAKEGEETGYFRSGKPSYRGAYKAGDMIGTWIWFNEDGTVKSTKEYTQR